MNAYFSSIPLHFYAFMLIPLDVNMSMRVNLRGGFSLVYGVRSYLPSVVLSSIAVFDLIFLRLSLVGSVNWGD